MTTFTIGQLAQAASVHRETIRYYQRRALVIEPLKTQGGIRRYPAEVVQRIRFIKAAQELGFTLEEIGELLELDGAKGCSQTRKIAEARLEDIDEKLRSLRALRETLARLVERCRSARGRPCPLILDLEHAARGPQAAGR